MAKKSNKTEHVLKLITKDEDLLEESRKEPPETVKAPPPVKEREGAAKAKETRRENKKELKKEAPAPRNSETSQSPEEARNSEISQNTGGLGRSTVHEEFKRGRLVNIAEILVTEKIEQIMKRVGVCNCPQCYNDVLAMTLNSLPPKYVTTHSGKQYLQLNIYKEQYETDVLAALTKACVRVKASPRHST